MGAGVIFAHSGALVRWLVSGIEGLINQRFVGDEKDDLSSHFRVQF